MKSKPLAIGIIVILVAVFLAVYNTNITRDKDTSSPGNPEQTEQQNQTKSTSRAQTRSTSRQAPPATSKEWEDRIDTLLGDDSISNDKACRGLLAIVLDAEAPISVRNDALEHALNLVEDEDFGLIQDIMGTKDKELPELLVQTILDDTLNRSDTVQLTTAIKVIPGNHTAVIEEAIELLEFHLELELGNNVRKWDQAVQAYIAKQKEELEE